MPVFHYINEEEGGGGQLILVNENVYGDEWMDVH